MHATIGIFGNPELAKKLGKAGTSNDIAIYNHASSEGVFTYVYPDSEKVQPLLQVIGMVDFPVVVFSQLTRELAEQVVALDAARFEHGFVVADGVPEEQIKQVVKGTTLERFPVLPNDPVELRQRIIQTPVKRDVESAPWLPIDNYFDVKSVGTVVLSVVKHGRIKKHDTLRIEPLGQAAVVKGIQSQDRDISEAEAGMRLGVNLKGVETKDLKRGYVVCKDAKVAREIVATFVKSRYAKEEVTQGSQIFAAVGLQVIAASVLSAGAGKLGLKLEQPLAYMPGQHCIFASTKQALPRILGSGVMEGEAGGKL